MKKTPKKAGGGGPHQSVKRRKVAVRRYKTIATKTAENYMGIVRILMASSKTDNEIYTHIMSLNPSDADILAVMGECGKMIEHYKVSQASHQFELAKKISELESETQSTLHTDEFMSFISECKKMKESDILITQETLRVRLEERRFEVKNLERGLEVCAIYLDIKVKNLTVADKLRMTFHQIQGHRYALDNNFSHSSSVIDI